MQFVHGLRGIQRIAMPAVFHPFLVSPFVGEIPDYGCSPWRYLASERKGVALIDRVTRVFRYDVILVHSAGADATQEPRPDAGRICSRFEAIRLRVPTVEISDHGDRGRIGRPDSEIGALFTRLVGRRRMGTQLLVRAEMRAFAEEV